jgi:hypothetical protein
MKVIVIAASSLWWGGGLHDDLIGVAIGRPRI